MKGAPAPATDESARVHRTDAYSSIWRDGRENWQFWLDPVAVSAILQACGVREGDAAELYLAVGCELADREALAAFDRAYLAAGRRLLEQRRTAIDVIDEVMQRLREELLVRRAPEPHIRLLRYAGSGRLRSLIRVSAARSAHYVERHVVRGSSTVRATVDAADSLCPALWTTDDPAVHVIDGERRVLFKRCFGQALAALPPRARALLRFHFVEELGYQRIAALLGVNKSTVCRQLAAARRQLHAGIARAWRIETREDLATVADLLEGELDLSLSRLLRSAR